jgi:hypothetical protein
VNAKVPYPAERQHGAIYKEMPSGKVGLVCNCGGGWPCPHYTPPVEPTVKLFGEDKTTEGTEDMDPQEAFTLLVDACRNHNMPAVELHGMTLIHWLNGGGFPPDVNPADLRQLVLTLTALATTWNLLNARNGGTPGGESNTKG